MDLKETESDFVTNIQYITYIRATMVIEPFASILHNSCNNNYVQQMEQQVKPGSELVLTEVPPGAKGSLVAAVSF